MTMSQWGSDDKQYHIVLVVLVVFSIGYLFIIIICHLLSHVLFYSLNILVVMLHVLILKILFPSTEWM